MCANQGQRETSSPGDIHVSIPVPLIGHYDFWLVALSIFIATLAAYAALDMSGRVTSARGRTRLFWLSGGALAMGSGIWSMHYIGMEVMRLPAMCRHTAGLVALSVVVAIAISAVALYLTFQFRGETQDWGWRKTANAVVLGSPTVVSGIA